MSAWGHWDAFGITVLFYCLSCSSDSFFHIWEVIALWNLEWYGRCTVVSGCSRPFKHSSECSFYKCSSYINSSWIYDCNITSLLRKQILFTYLNSELSVWNVAFPLLQVIHTLMFSVWHCCWCCKLLGAKWGFWKSSCLITLTFFFCLCASTITQVFWRKIFLSVVLRSMWQIKMLISVKLHLSP